MAQVDRLLPQAWLDLLAEVALVGDLSGQAQWHTGLPRGVQRQVRALVRHQATEPERMVANRRAARSPGVEIDPVGDHMTGRRQVRPTVGIGLGHGAVMTAPAPMQLADGVDQLEEGRGVQHGEHGRTDQPGHGHRHIVQGVVEDDVEAMAVDALQAVEIAMVLVEVFGAEHATLAPAAVRAVVAIVEDGHYLQLGRRGGAGEQGHRMATLAQLQGDVIGKGFETTGEGLAYRVLHVGENAYAHGTVRLLLPVIPPSSSLAAG